VREALSLHAQGFQEISEFVAQQKANVNASASADDREGRKQRDELKEQLLAEIRKSQEAQNSMLLEAQARSRSDVQRLVAEVVQSEEEKHREMLEASKATVTYISDALAPLTRHVMDIDSRQQEVADALREQCKDNGSENQQAHALAAATCANVAARQEAAQERLMQEVQESLEFQRLAFSEAQAGAEQAAQRQVQEMLAKAHLSSMTSHKEFEAKLQRMLEDRQRDVLQKSQAMTTSMRNEISETLVPLSQHVQEVERRQEEDLKQALLSEQRAHLQLQSELRYMRESEERALEAQKRTEAAIQGQVCQALDSFKRQVMGASRRGDPAAAGGRGAQKAAARRASRTSPHANC